MKICFYFFLFFLVLCKENNSQTGVKAPGNFSIDQNSVGIILADDSIPVGTGFVAIKNNYVITDAHVVRKKKKLSYWATEPNEKIPLKIITAFPNSDLAILVAEKDICKTPLSFNDTLANPGAGIIYVGLDMKRSFEETGVVAFNLSYILAKGMMLYGAGEAEFIDFVGDGLPGYSGGPVFDMNGSVIAVMYSVYCYDPILNKLNNKNCLNRAHSVRDLRSYK